MGGYINIQKHAFLKEVWDEGKAEGIVEGEAKTALAMLSAQLEDKFGPLPAWASSRLRKTSTGRIRELSRKVLTAKKLEDIVRRK